MQRYFVKTSQIVDNQVTITGDDVHHITNVMRATVGEQLLVCTDERQTFLVAVETMNKTEIIARIVAPKEEDVEMPIMVAIAQGITKGDKFDLVVQKATECGAATFIPVAMKRSVAKIDASKAAKKVERWQKIALEAARQAHRQIVPEVVEPIDMKGLVALATDYDVCLFAYETFDATSRTRLATVVDDLSGGERVLVLIGPEGGFDATEVALLESDGFLPIGLGPRILRTETAPIYVMAALSYALEVEGGSMKC